MKIENNPRPGQAFYACMVIVFTICWAPSALTFSLDTIRQNDTLLDQLLYVLTYLPFMIAYLSGLFFGNAVILRLAGVSFVAEIFINLLLVQDLNLIDGGSSIYWTVEDSLRAMLILIGLTIAVTAVGSLSRFLFQNFVLGRGKF